MSNQTVPGPDEIRAFLQKHNLTGSAAAKITGVDSRTIRRWTADPSARNHSPIPWAAWVLLQVATGYTDPQNVLEQRRDLERKAARGEMSPLEYWQALQATFKTMTAEEQDREYRDLTDLPET